MLCTLLRAVESIILGSTNCRAHCTRQALPPAMRFDRFREMGLFVGIAWGFGAGCSSSTVSCKLGGACTPSQVCSGGVQGCASDCKCIEGTWEAPCPTDVPQNASACSIEGVTCGYTTKNTACNGSMDCSCQRAAWSCAPTCVVTDASSQYTSDGGGHDAGLICRLGGMCSPAQPCPGGIEGCVSNCQCLDGTWQTPCPTGMPKNASACPIEGVTCGYITQSTACGGSVDCSCQMASWSCAPTCVVVDASSPEQ